MIALQNKYIGNGARLLAAPKPIGIEIAIPITVDVTVIMRLSIIPSLMSDQRPAKFGFMKPKTNFAPRSSPS